MNFVLQPWQLLFLILAGWVNHEQQEVIEYLLTENAVLKEKLGKKRILLSDDQRRRLAVTGMALGRKRLKEIGTLFTPDTILRWHRQLVAQKWDYSDRQEKRQGRPRVRQVIVNLAVKFAKENPSWGCDRIQGALANVGYEISDTTVENLPVTNALRNSSLFSKSVTAASQQISDSASLSVLPAKNALTELPGQKRGPARERFENAVNSRLLTPLSPLLTPLSPQRCTGRLSPF